MKAKSGKGGGGGKERSSGMVEIFLPAAKTTGHRVVRVVLVVLVVVLLGGLCQLSKLSLPLKCL